MTRKELCYTQLLCNRGPQERQDSVQRAEMAHAVFNAHPAGQKKNSGLCVNDIIFAGFVLGVLR